MSVRSEIEDLMMELDALSPSGFFFALRFRFALPLLHYQSYDSRWIDIYTEQAFALRDPIIAWGFSTTGTSRWSEIEIPDPFGILEQAKEYGMLYGAAISCGPMKSRTIAAAAREDREFTDREIDAIAKVIYAMHERTEPPTNLTAAQIEALRLIAEGDRHTAAAARLNISESALKARLNAARQRLLARTTAEAIQRARDYGMI